MKSNIKTKYKLNVYVPNVGKIEEIFPHNKPIQYKINNNIFAEIVIDEAFYHFQKSVDDNLKSDYVSSSIKKAWKQLQNAVYFADYKKIDTILYKYIKEAHRGTGGIGAGPGKMKTSRRGVQQLYEWTLYFLNNN